MKLAYSSFALGVFLTFGADLRAQVPVGPPPARPQPKNLKKSDKVAQRKQQQAQEIERFERMSPEERKKALDKLPPERRERIMQVLGRLQQMPPGERQRLRQRFDRFQALPDDRKRAVRQELHRLRTLSPEDRAKRLKSSDTKKHFNEEERRLLEEVSAPGAGPPAF